MDADGITSNRGKILPVQIDYTIFRYDKSKKNNRNSLNILESLLQEAGRVMLVIS